VGDPITTGTVLLCCAGTSFHRENILFRKENSRIQTRVEIIQALDEGTRFPTTGLRNERNILAESLHGWGGIFLENSNGSKNQEARANNTKQVKDKFLTKRQRVR
jgi:hypothetical protein